MGCNLTARPRTSYRAGTRSQDRGRDRSGDFALGSGRTKKPLAGHGIGIRGEGHTGVPVRSYPMETAWAWQTLSGRSPHRPYYSVDRIARRGATAVTKPASGAGGWSRRPG
jgi:hypothetical protein